MPLYEARITIKPAATQWRFEAEGVDSAKRRLQEKLASMVGYNVVWDIREVRE